MKRMFGSVFSVQSVGEIKWNLVRGGLGGVDLFLPVFLVGFGYAVPAAAFFVESFLLLGLNLKESFFGRD